MLCESYYECGNCGEKAPSSEMKWVGTDKESPVEISFEQVSLFDDSDQMWCSDCREEEIWGE